jgi:hypothetical protein
MVHRLVDRGLASSKIWAFAASATELLWTETPYCSDGRAQWWYHVAPVLTVRGPGGDAQEMVFSPDSLYGIRLLVFRGSIFWSMVHIYF